MKFLNTLFSTTGLLIAIYILIGIFYNTAPPHIPSTAPSFTSLHKKIFNS